MMSSTTSPRDVDGVAAQPTDHPVGDAERRGLDEELVVALEAVDLDDLDVRVADVEAGAEDAADVITMSSANSVPSTTTLSKPVPPSIETGALTLYETSSSPPPARMSSGRAVEKPSPMIGTATPSPSSGMTSSCQPCSTRRSRR